MRKRRIPFTQVAALSPGGGGPPPVGVGIITEASDQIITEGGDNLVTE